LEGCIRFGWGDASLEGAMRLLAQQLGWIPELDVSVADAQAALGARA
jgi:hypothetical protein